MTYVERALNVRKSELLPASLLAAYLALAMGCFIMGKSIADSLLLSRFGNGLPEAIAATALVVAVFISVYVRLSHRVAPRRLIPGVLLFFAVSYAGFGVLAHFRQDWACIPAYLWVYAGGVICPAMGWTLANYTLTTREARRVFGLIGAGPILGGACAGFLTAAAGRHIPTETMFFMLAGFQALACLPVRQLFRKMPLGIGGSFVTPAALEDGPRDFFESCRALLRSRYLLLITALIAISCFCSTVADFQFKMIARAHFAADKDVMTAFFGRFYGWMGLGSFLLQLALTGRLLRTLGIRVTLFILPVLFIGGSLGVLLVPTILSVGVLRGTHHLLRYSVDKSSLELLYLPVSTDVKVQLKPFIDSFIWRLADGVAGLVLFLFADGLHVSPGRMSLVNLVFLAGWITIAHMTRKEYLNVLREAIQRRTLDPDRMAARVLDHGTSQVVARLLENAEPGQVLYGLSLFDLSREPAWHPYLRELLSHPSAAVRERALSLLCDGGDLRIVHKVEHLVDDESPGVRGEALRYLVVHSGRDPVELLMDGRMDMPDSTVRAAIVVYLMMHGKKEQRVGAAFLLKAMVEQKGADGVEARTAAARALGLIPEPSEGHAALIQLIHDEDVGVAEQALISAGRIRAPELLPDVLACLGRARLIPTARNTIVQYGSGVLATLRDCLHDGALPVEVKSRIPAVLAMIPDPESVGILSASLLHGDPGFRFDILRALNRLRRRNPALVRPAGVYEDLLDLELIGLHRSIQILAVLRPGAISPLTHKESESLLVRVLRERMNYELERIFLLLALLYPQRDIQNAYHGLISGRPQLQANSLEVLEHLLRPETYKVLVHAVDFEIPDEVRVEFTEKLCRHRVETRTEALRILLQAEDRWLRLCAVYEIGDTHVPDLWEDLKSLAREEDSLFLETWKWSLERLSMDASFQ